MKQFYGKGLVPATVFVIAISLLIHIGRAAAQDEQSEENRAEKFFSGEETKGGHSHGSGHGQYQNTDQNMRFPRLRKMLGNMSPEEIERLKNLHKENPEAFKEEMRKRFQEGKCSMGGDSKEVQELIQKYQQTEDIDEKDNCRNQIRECLRKQFRERMEINRKRLEETENRIKELRRKLEDRQKRAEEIIEEHLRDLTKDPDLRW